ncbi:Fe-S cluster assembly ATPase SufC [Candidatus Gracilibacteria bacterium]|nr:Fe-S cluster assembly ATPase SufC [Candidatus Gracilibacteria bacterium]
MNTLEIIDIHAEVDGQKILKGLSLTISSGQIHTIMGPNGSGKSTLCKVLMGHPKYEVTKGEALFNGENILEMEPEERAKLGLFLGFQHPIEIAGVTLGNFLRHSKMAITGEKIGPVAFMKTMKAKTEELGMHRSFIGRGVNEGFSGGEKKRTEIAQMAVLEPKIALLDEIDSGLDIDALEIVSEGINKNFEQTNCGILLITHYQRILNYIKPHHVHIMHDGRIIKSGGAELAQELEDNGYKKYV